MARTKGSKNRKKKVVKAEKKPVTPVGIPDVPTDAFKGPMKVDIEAATKRAQKYNDEVYEPAVEEEAKQAVDDFNEVIATEKELLNHFSEDKMHVKITNQGKLFEFDLRQVSGSDDLKAIQLDLSVYSTLTDKERELVVKKNEGQKPLSNAETRLYEKINAKLENEMGGKILDQVHDVLAQFVTPPCGSVEENKKFWETRVPFDFKTFLADAVMDRLGINQTTDVKLFQAS